jgi:PAS domain S-box-containing protein
MGRIEVARLRSPARPSAAASGEAEAAAALTAAIFDQTSDAILICDAKGSVVRASRAARALLGRNPLHQDLASAVPLIESDPSGRKGMDVRALLEGILRGETIRQKEVLFLHPGVRHGLWLLLSASPLRSSGAVAGGVLTLTDITGRKHAEENARLQARRQDEFLAMLAHELRNPLTPILYALHILKNPAAGESFAVEAREVIGRQAEQMARLIDNLLDVSRIARGKIRIDKSMVRLSDAVMSAVEAVRPLIEERRQELTVSLPAEGLLLEADPARLSQIVGNILDNATKYTPKMGSIRISAGIEGGEAVLRVRDSGVGISPDMLPRVFDLFDLFMQTDDSPARPQRGLGIGLTLVRLLTELHGGKVEAFSEGTGRGSEFVVRLPLPEATPLPKAYG